MDDILKNLFGGFGASHHRKTGGYQNSGYQSSGYQGSGYQNSGFGGMHFSDDFSENGSDMQCSLEVGFDEAAFGCKKRIRLQNENGQSQSLEVQIPAGIADGKVLRLKGQGMQGTNGGKAGDILLKVSVQDKPGYHREGQDVYTTASIPFVTAALGGEAEIPTIYGKVVCKIKPGTQSGSQIRLKGKGIVTMGNAAVYGDQYVTVQIQVPTSLTPRERQKLEEFAQLGGKKGFGGHAA